MAAAFVVLMVDIYIKKGEGGGGTAAGKMIIKPK